METYLIDPRSNGGGTFTVEATDHGHAAQIAAKQMFRAKSAIQVERLTGDGGGSGMFQAYHQLRTPEFRLNSVGNSFHITEL